MAVANIAEEWKPIPGQSGYEVSNLGHVRSYRHPRGFEGPRLLALFMSKKTDGYARIGIRQPTGKLWMPLVHRLVAEAFLARIDGLDEVHHKDHDKLNNAASNLEWTTRSQNLKYYHVEQRRLSQRS